MNKTQKFIENNTLVTIFKYCNSLVSEPTEEHVSELKEFLMFKNHSLIGKHSIPKYVSRLFILLGRKGFEALEELVKVAPGSIYTQSILNTICLASQGKLQELPFVDNEAEYIIKPNITPEIQDLAHKSFVNIVVESLGDEDQFFNLIQFLYMGTLSSSLEEKKLDKSIFEIITKSSFKINEKLLSNFEELINTEQKEEVYQTFMENNPCLIDPLAVQIFNKTKLGTEFITDFVVKKLNDQYILVEIEKPYSKIFTERNDFSFEFTHAMGQILDFQEWVEANIAYAQKLMPSIISPRGLLIIGMKSRLKKENFAKLKRFNINNMGRIRVMTFDEVLEQGKIYYKNMHSERSY